MCATPRRRRFRPPRRARSAEERAAADWKFDLKPYALLEQSQQTRPGGRIDHTFVYQRAEMLGEARIRLRLTVAGDELIEIAPYVHLPESLERRFRELRSANDTIAGVAGIVGRAPLRAGRLHPRRAVARAPALARRRGRRSPRDSSSAD